MKERTKEGGDRKINENIEEERQKLEGMNK
jgi:hypothetical protein